MNKTRTAAQRSLLALEHHGKEFKERAYRITFHLAVLGWPVRSTHGGANSWEFKHPSGKTYKLRGRANTGAIEVLCNGVIQANLYSRLDVDNFFASIA